MDGPQEGHGIEREREGGLLSRSQHVHKSRQLLAAAERRNGQRAGDIREFLKLCRVIVNIRIYS